MKEIIVATLNAVAWGVAIGALALLFGVPLGVAFIIGGSVGLATGGSYLIGGAVESNSTRAAIEEDRRDAEERAARVSAKKSDEITNHRRIANDVKKIKIRQEVLEKNQNAMRKVCIQAREETQIAQRNTDERVLELEQSSRSVEQRAPRKKQSNPSVQASKIEKDENLEKQCQEKSFSSGKSKQKQGNASQAGLAADDRFFPNCDTEKKRVRRVRRGEAFAESPSPNP